MGLTQGTTLTSSDGEKTAVFESYFTPAFTEITVKDVAIRLVTIESVSGTFAVGDTLTKGSGGDTTTATVFAVTDSESNVIVHVGPSTINGSGSEFADGDSVSALVVLVALSPLVVLVLLIMNLHFTESGGTESLFNGVALNVFNDRTYRFNVADSSMSSRFSKFLLQSTVNMVLMEILQLQVITEQSILQEKQLTELLVHLVHMFSMTSLLTLHHQHIITSMKAQQVQMRVLDMVDLIDF